MARKDGLSEAMWDYFVRRLGRGTQYTAFGENVSVEQRAYITGHAVYNFIPSNFRTFTALSGIATAANRLFKCSTGTTQFGYGAIQSFRNINAKVGRSLITRFSGYFETGVADYIQGIGLLSIGDETSFGYNGESFGIWHRYGGLNEVREIQVTGASGGSTNLTLTLNGVIYTIPLTSGTVQHNAYEIEAWLNANQSVWAADQLDDTVIISALSDGVKSGTYTFSHGTATGTITQITAGVTKTSDFYAQEDWNGAKLHRDFDETKGNVYQIILQNMGYGDIIYYVENPSDGEFYEVHRIINSSKSTSTSLGNPSLRCGMYVASLGGSGTNLSCYADSFYAGIQGSFYKTRNPRAESVVQSITTTNETELLTIRNRKTYNGYNNQVEVDPLIVSVSNETVRNATIRIRTALNTNIEQNFQTVGNNLVIDVDKTAIVYSGGTVLASRSVGPTGEVNINLNELEVNLPPSLKLVVTVERAATGGSNQNFTGTVSWYEDI